MKILLLLLIPSFLFAQSTFDKDIETAFENAKKGVYYALSNIPERKSSLSSDLIDNDRLIASIKLYKEIDGVKIESEGNNNSYTVKVTIFRSYANLLRDGIIKRMPPE